MGGSTVGCVIVTLFLEGQNKWALCFGNRKRLRNSGSVLSLGQIRVQTKRTVVAELCPAPYVSIGRDRTPTQALQSGPARAGQAR